MKKVFVYAFYSDKVLDSKKKPSVGIGGAEVQLAFWSKALSEIAKVYSFSYDIRQLFSLKRYWGIRFLFFPLIPKLNAFLFYLRPLWLLFVRPDYVILKAASQELGFLLKMRKLLKFKLVYFLASDNDVVLDDTKEKKRIQIAIHEADYLIAQNSYQESISKDVLRLQRVLQLKNIWDKDVFPNEEVEKTIDLIWVGKFNPNKRPEWFVEMAKENPDKKFAMISATSKGYQKLLDEINGIDNLEYWGYKSFFETTDIIRHSKCLVCTSGFEGFPNTFLQAFTYNIPVLSTVNPSNIITDYNLGFVYKTVEEANEIIQEQRYCSINPKAIEEYLNNNHNPIALRKALASFIEL